MFSILKRRMAVRPLPGGLHALVGADDGMADLVLMAATRGEANALTPWRSRLLRMPVSIAGISIGGSTFGRVGKVASSTAMLLMWRRAPGGGGRRGGHRVALLVEQPEGR